MSLTILNLNYLQEVSAISGNYRFSTICFNIYIFYIGKKNTTSWQQRTWTWNPYRSTRVMAHVAFAYFFSPEVFCTVYQPAAWAKSSQNSPDFTEKRSHVFLTQRSLKQAHIACTQTSVHALAQRDAIHSFTLSFLQPLKKERRDVSGDRRVWDDSALSLPLSTSLSHSSQSALSQHQSRGRRLGLKWITSTDSVCPHWTELISRLSRQLKNSLSVCHAPQVYT